MHIHIVKPFSLEKNLGKVYNDTMNLLPAGDWACLMDIDSMFLTPEQPALLYEYANRFPNALLTCFVNRVSTLSTKQLLKGFPDENSDIRHHLPLAENQQAGTLKGTEIAKDISGTLMLLSKKLWQQYPFDETGKCLGVDTYYGRRLRAAGVKIIRMDNIYIWHTYRLLHGIHDKTHLK